MCQLFYSFLAGLDFKTLHLIFCWTWKKVIMYAYNSPSFLKINIVYTLCRKTNKWIQAEERKREK